MIQGFCGLFAPFAPHFAHKPRSHREDWPATVQRPIPDSPCRPAFHLPLPHFPRFIRFYRSFWGTRFIFCGGFPLCPGTFASLAPSLPFPVRNLTVRGHSGPLVLLISRVTPRCKSTPFTPLPGHTCHFFSASTMVFCQDTLYVKIKKKSQFSRSSRLPAPGKCKAMASVPPFLPSAVNSKRLFFSRLAVQPCISAPTGSFSAFFFFF